MKYKFFGTPNMLVLERKASYHGGELLHKPCFRFDENGEYITEDTRIIAKAKSRFDHMEIIETVQEEIEEEVEIPIDLSKSLSCKKCDFTTSNKGDLLSHYKTHKK